jgi:general secretion pathway protein D
VIDKLDARRAQVFVESLIAEVSAEKAAEFGVQWQGPVGNKGDNNIGLLGTNFKVGGANLISLATQGATGTVAPSSGRTLACTQQQRHIRARILSALLANHRRWQRAVNAKPADAGQRRSQNRDWPKRALCHRPVHQQQYQPQVRSIRFKPLKRKDVGLTLRVKPQISENGTVKLQIYQEVSRLDPASIGVCHGSITNKRSIESSVLVEDGAIVVLGGLLQDDYGNSQERCRVWRCARVWQPVRAPNPEARKKTNLMVFLRPVVVRDGSCHRWPVDGPLRTNARCSNGSPAEPASSGSGPQLGRAAV